MQLFLAPIRGHTDYIYRNTLARHFSGIDIFFSPFITTVKGHVVKESHIRDIIPKYNKGLVVVPQIIGKNAEEFIVLANQIAAMGYPVVNWNLGCPYPMVVNKKRGAGLLPYPELIRDFLAEVIPTLTCKLSVKLRLGKDDPSDINAVLPVLNAFPLEEIIIHPRTAAQMYSGSADAAAFSKCLAKTEHSVVYNGDIVDVKTFRAITELCPAITKFMIGRGMLMNPALAEQIKDIAAPSQKTQLQRIRNFHDDIMTEYYYRVSGEITLLDLMKQLWWYLSYSLANREKAVLTIQRAKNIKEYKAAVEKAFTSDL